jgi:hypothetical protein
VPRHRLRRLAYVALDDIEGERVVLSVTGWPAVDSAGRLRFPAGAESSHVVVDGAALAEHLAARRPRARAGRELRVGDVFAARVRPGVDLDGVVAPAAWLRRPVYDVTAEAREAAKAAFLSAVAPTLDPALAKQLIEEDVRIGAEAAPPGAQPGDGGVGRLGRLRDVLVSPAAVVAVGAGAGAAGYGVAVGLDDGRPGGAVTLVATTTVREGTTIAETVTVTEGSTIVETLTVTEGATIVETVTRTVTVTEGETGETAAGTVTEEVGVAVPGLVGLAQPEAEQALLAEGLVAEVVATATETEPGTVVAQDPAEGSIVESGATVTIDVAEEPEPVVD